MVPAVADCPPEAQATPSIHLSQGLTGSSPQLQTLGHHQRSFLTRPELAVHLASGVSGLLQMLSCLLAGCWLCSLVWNQGNYQVDVNRFQVSSVRARYIASSQVIKRIECEAASRPSTDGFAHAKPIPSCVCRSNPDPS